MFSRTVCLIILLVMTFLDMIIEIVVGHWFHSTTLVADAFHMLNDVLSLAVSLVTIRLATHTSRNNTFGWVRLEVLGALANGIFLVTLCFSLLLDALTHFTKEQEIKDPLTVLIVGAVGLAVNVIGVVLFHEHAHGHSHGHSHSHDRKSNLNAVEYSKPPQPGFEEDACMLNMHEHKGVAGKVLNMRGVYLHLLSDLFGSLIVMFSAGLIMIFKENTFIRFYLDPSLTILIVLILVAVTAPFIKEAAMILLECTPKDVDVEDVKQALLKIDGVSTVRELHIWRLTEEKTIASVHVNFRHETSDYKRSVEAVKALFRDRGVNIVTVQAELEEPSCKTQGDAVVITNEKIEPVSAALLLRDRGANIVTVHAEVEEVTLPSEPQCFTYFKIHLEKTEENNKTRLQPKKKRRRGHGRGRGHRQPQSQRIVEEMEGIHGA